MYKPLLAITLVALTGCTAVSVEPLAEKPQHMCIKRNPKVIIEDFVPVLQAGLRRHGIESTLYDSVPLSCSQIMEYTARRSWDMAPYLSTAEIVILGPRRQTLAKANYHLRGKGGLSLMKWQGTKSKIDPVIDELLANVQLTATVAAEAQRESASPRSKSLDEQIRELQQQHLGYEDYQRAYRKLLLENQASD